MMLLINEEDATHIDRFSVILDKGDCMLFLHPVRKGVCLHEIEDIPGLDKVAPLIFNLGIPVNMRVPDNAPDPREYALGVLAVASPECNDYILESHRVFREDGADLFIASIDIFDTKSLYLTGRVGWKMDALRCHKRDYDPIIGVDNYVYYNISKRIDALR
jgi:hypothetical protein